MLFFCFTSVRAVMRLESSLLILICLALLPMRASQATPTVTVLHSFSDGTVTGDGIAPDAPLIQASDGNFYGTTYDGGAASEGTVFKMTPTGAITILHSFPSGATDGANPYGALVQGRDGNFYGTTYFGGSANSGTVFKMTTAGSVTILHSFQDGTVTADGQYPLAALVQGSDGNFYGTTYSGGSTARAGQPYSGSGAVYKITPAGTVTILHSFRDGSVASDGASPWAALIQAGDGNFYGTTASGGTVSAGTAYKMTPAGVVTVLHAFQNAPTDGFQPVASLLQGSDGNFYGTTGSGGSASDGTVFKITPQGAETILHTFNDGAIAHDGTMPLAALVLGSDGSFYGTTTGGGSASDGTIFKITTAGAVTILHAFGDGSTADDGKSPHALLLGSNGNFYGTTTSGGATAATGSAGTVYALSLTTVTALTSISPATVQAGALAFMLTATGSGFVSGATVDWNGAALTTTYVSASQVTAMVPASDAAATGTAQITVVDPGPLPTNALPLTITAEPTLTALSPSSVQVGHSDFTLTVTGTNFVTGAMVDWNGAALTTTFVSATQVTAAVPASDVTATGTAQVTVANPHVTPTPALTFTISAAPTITMLSPSTIPIGNAPVTLTITGTNFAAGAVVDWNGTALTSAFLSPTTMVAQVPASDLAAAATAYVTVVNPSVPETNSLPVMIVGGTTATITSLSSSSAVSGSAAVILTVTGTGFATGATVDWNGTALTSFVFGATTITAQIPASDLTTAGTDHVTVANPGAGPSNTLAFTVTPSAPKPTIASFTPAGGRAGTSVVITGTNFTGATVVGFTGAHASFTVNSATQITATVPAGAATGPLAVATPGGQAKSATSFTVTP